MRTLLAMLVIALSSGCAYYTVDDGSREREARAQCKALAKNLVQIARCDNR